MLEPQLEALLPSEIRVVTSPIGDHVEALLPEEMPAIAKAVVSRKHEFATGRMLARQLLQEFGQGAPPLLRDSDRVPVWPEGFVGSITHSGELCVAAVGRASEFRGIGIDCEPDEPVGEDVERVVCRGPEHDWVAAGVGEERGRRCRTVFSVKEAVYKAFYPRTRVFWSFQDVGVTIDLEAGRFLAVLPESAWVSEVEGRIVRSAGWIVSGTALR